MHQYPQIPEYSEMPELSYRSRIAFRVLQRENGFSIPDDDDKYIDWLAQQSDSERYQLMTPGYDRSYIEEFVLQRIYSKFRERMGDDICYGFFSECLDAATRSCFAGPAPYCGFGIYAPFYHVCVKYEKSAPGYGMPWDRYSYNVASFFMRGFQNILRECLIVITGHQTINNNQIWYQKKTNSNHPKRLIGLMWRI